LKILSRELLGKTHQSHLKKSDLLVTFCGDIEYEQFIGLIQPLIDAIPNKKSPAVKLKAAKPILDKKVFIPFQREQTHIFIGTNASNFTQTEDNYLKMFTTYLSGQSSELFVEVRDKQGLCYSVQPVHHSALEAGYWGIYIGTGHEKTARAIDAINSILKRISNEGLPQSEFNRIKKMIDGQNLLNIQTNDDYANLYSISTLHGLGLDHQHNSYEFIRNAEYEKFQRYIKNFLAQKWNTIIVGNS
jgi:zinc protease